MKRVDSAEVLDLLDGDPQVALAEALRTAETFAQDQHENRIGADLTLNGTFFYVDGEEQRDRDGYDMRLFTAASNTDAGWVLSTASNRVNRWNDGHGLVLLPNGEVGTWFTARLNPIFRLGNAGIMGNLLYGMQGDAPRVDQTTVIKPGRSRLETPSGPEATQLAGKILLGIFQRQNYQERRATKAA